MKADSLKSDGLLILMSHVPSDVHSEMGRACDHILLYCNCPNATQQNKASLPVLRGMLRGSNFGFSSDAFGCDGRLLNNPVQECALLIAKRLAQSNPSSFKCTVYTRSRAATCC